MNNVKEVITLIVPTFNKSSRLRYLLESLKGQDMQLSFAIIIVDDGSEDSTKQVIDEYRSDLRINYIYQKNSGRSHARNTGLSNASTPYVIFCDDDLILCKSFVREHFQALLLNSRSVVHGRIWSLPYLQFFEDPGNGDVYQDAQGSLPNNTSLKKYMIGVDAVDKQDLLEKQKRETFFEKCLYQIADENKENLKFLLCTGGNFSSNREVLLDLGGFDETLDRLWGVEDLELGYRLQQQNYMFFYHQYAYNYHIMHYRKTYKEELQDSVALFYQKHRDPLIPYLPELLLGKVKNLNEFENMVKRHE